MAMQFDQKYKDSVGVKITIRIGQGIKNGEISDSELPEICQYVLVALDHMSDMWDMQDFLKKLSARWPVFAEIASDEIKRVQTVSSIEAQFTDRNTVAETP